MHVMKLFVLISTIAGFAVLYPYAIASNESHARLLREGWLIAPSRFVEERGESVSTREYQPRNWYPATVPTTVLAALVADKVYDDPFFGMNLRSIPGTAYPIGAWFSNLMMPPDSPFAGSWWYRTEFRIDPGQQRRTFWIQFDGLNFRANVWLNGHRVADANQVAGTFRSYEFDVTGAIAPDEVNVLAVEVFPPQPHDLQLSWADISPAPPDKNMGIWRPVRILATGPVAIRRMNVVSRLDLPSLQTAHIHVSADLENSTDQTIKGVIKGQIGTIQFERFLQLAAKTTDKIAFDSSEFPQLDVASPRLWWPVNMGPQNLYTARLEFVYEGQTSDEQSLSFGIRHLASEITPQGYRVFKINGRPVLIRGALWWPDMLLRNSPERQDWEIRYAVNLNLNAIRMDGKFEDQHFLELADRAGLMLMPGWLCCDHWERWSSWDKEDYSIAGESLRDVIRAFRTHPSVITWFHGDDNPPPPEVERQYTAILKEEDWPNVWQSSTRAKDTIVSGATGYKFHTGPYTWVPPSYWLTDHEAGGAFGFITEASPTAAIPPVESIRKMLPVSHLKPIDEFWNYHSSAGKFTGVDVEFTKALSARMGIPRDLEDYATKAQLMGYEAERAMFEAYGRNKYGATGILHENLNSAWPSFNWSLYDYYLRPGGGYFGAKKACEPLHVQYSYDDRSIVVVNSLYNAFSRLTVSAEAYDVHLNRLSRRSVSLDVQPDSSTTAFTISPPAAGAPMYFLRLDLKNSAGQLVSTNFYWLATAIEHPETGKYANFTGLRHLPKVSIETQAVVENRPDNEDTISVTLTNHSSHLAFFIRVMVCNEQDKEEILPVLWQDNYITLMPGEVRTLSATVKHDDLKTPNAVKISGWNVAAESIKVHSIGRE